VRRQDDECVEATAHGTVSQPEPYGEVACCARNADPDDACTDYCARCGHYHVDCPNRASSNTNDNNHDRGDNDVVNVHHHDIFYNDNIVDFYNDNIVDNDHGCGDNDDIDRGMAVLWTES
jgi:hypothetical protein